MRTTSVVSMAVATLLMLSAWGCEPKKEDAAKKTSAEGESAHVHGPNGGEIIELGAEEYHAELLQDVDEKMVTVFILDKDAKTAVPIAAETVTIRMTINDKPTEFTLPAKPMEGETAGNSSRFQSTDEPLSMALGNEMAQRELEVKIGEKPYKASFPYYEPHDHGHAHDEEDHKDHDHKDHDEDSDHKEHDEKQEPNAAEPSN